jgi:quinol monooxygenase YgiN
MNERNDLAALAAILARTAVAEATNLGYTSTADDDDLEELSLDIETWLKVHMQRAPT